MATEEHKQLALYLKHVHSSLRTAATNVGAEEAWKQHCKNKDVLRTYAKCMEKLATIYWDNNCANHTNSTSSRIQWVAELCYEYFITKMYVKHRQKDIDVAQKNNIALHFEHELPITHSDTIKLIDVGSCYNPFKVYDFLNVTAIDLLPANDTVLECDFINVAIGSGTIIENLALSQLEENSFDAVVFCFVLEYIPTSELRMKACSKAYSLLKPEGLLIITTPDSKHVGANCRVMKCWQYSLALMGFNRIKYEKLKHMHCMAFRKTLHKDIAVRWAEIHKKPFMENAMNIPQDFNNSGDISQEYPREKWKISLDDFSELPFYQCVE